MAMANGGSSKLLEELGELAQVAAKLQACAPGSFLHWSGDLRPWLEGEMGDVIGAIAFMIHKHGLSNTTIQGRASDKLRQFLEWDAEPDNTPPL